LVVTRILVILLEDTRQYATKGSCQKKSAEMMIQPEQLEICCNHGYPVPAFSEVELCSVRKPIGVIYETPLAFHAAVATVKHS